MINLNRLSLYPRIALSIFLTAMISCGHALDNPEAPSYLGAFQSRAQHFEQAIGEAVSAKAAAEARGNYEKFLDTELASTYNALLSKLPVDQKRQLQESQEIWLRYRDAETTFINDNWTPANFGSSAAMSRHAYRMAIIRSRIEQLMGYLVNY